MKVKFFVLLCLFALVVGFCFSIAYPSVGQSDREILRLGRGTANSLDWRPDGKVLAVGGGTGLWLYDVNFEVLAHLLDGQSINTLRWNVDGTRLALATDANLIQIWEIADNGTRGRTALSLHGKDEISSFSWSPDGKRLASVTWANDSVIQIWDTQSGDLIREIPDANWKAVWSPDGSKIAGMTNENYGVAIWDVSSGQIIQTFNGVASDLFWTSVAWSPDGKLLAGVSSLPASLHVWNVDTGEIVNKPDTSGDMFSFYDVVWTEDAKYVICTDRPVSSPMYGDIERWDASTWENTRLIGWDYGFRDIKLHPHGKTLVGITFDSMLVNFDISSFEAVKTYSLHQPNAYFITWNPDSTQIAVVSGYEEKHIQIWDVLPTPIQVELPRSTLNAGEVKRIVWDNEDNLILEIERVGDFALLYYIEVWDWSSGERERSIFDWQGQAFPVFVPNASFSKLAVGNTDTSEIKIRSVSSEEALVTFKSPSWREIAWSPDDTTLAVTRTTTMNNLQLWDTVTGQMRAEFNLPPGLRWNSWSPDSSKVAIFVKNGEETQIIRHASGDIITLPSHSGLTAWSPDSSIFAISAYDSQELTFWDSNTGKLLTAEPLEGTALFSWSPDSTMLALGLSDGTIRIWDVSDVVSREKE